MQNLTPSAQLKGLGFLVDNLLSEYESKNENNYDDEKGEYNDSYDKIKRSIVELYKKINQRKMYNNNNNNNNNAVSYINYSKIREQYRELLNMLYKTINEKTNETTDKHRAKWHAVMMYRLLAFTRAHSNSCI